MASSTLLATESPTLTTWLLLAWLFSMGACIGSFMNVVIYRLPAGLSLLRPASHCPKCQTPIPPATTCQSLDGSGCAGVAVNAAPISPRYPAVEFLVAVVFVGLAWAEPLCGGDNLLVGSAVGLTQNQLWGLYAFHLFLLCSLICAGFIDSDGHRLPVILISVPLLVGMGAPSVWPWLRPGEVLSGVEPHLLALIDGLLGLIAGAASATWLGWAVGFGGRKTVRPIGQPRGFFSSFGLDRRLSRLAAGAAAGFGGERQ